jgi:hypothetical protein
MLFKQRKVRHSSKFSSRIGSSSRSRREYAATSYSTALIQLILAVTLFIAAFWSYQAVAVHGQGVGLLLKLILPVVFSVGGLLVARTAVRNLQAARSAFHRRPARDDSESNQR